MISPLEYEISMSKRVNDNYMTSQLRFNQMKVDLVLKSNLQISKLYLSGKDL